MDQKDSIIVFSVVKVPGTAEGVHFYLIDQSVGLSLIDAEKGRKYVLSTEQSFSEAQTLSVALLDKTGRDPTKGFRVLKIDQTKSARPEIMAYNFDESYLKELDQL